MQFINLPVKEKNFLARSDESVSLFIGFWINYSLFSIIVFVIFIWIIT